MDATSVDIAAAAAAAVAVAVAVAAAAAAAAAADEKHMGLAKRPHFALEGADFEDSLDSHEDRQEAPPVLAW